MSGSLTRGGGENVPGIPGACTTRYLTYLVRGPLAAPEVVILAAPYANNHISVSVLHEISQCVSFYQVSGITMLHRKVNWSDMSFVM